MPDPINWSLALPYLLGALAFGYLLGSIPFGLIFTRLAGLGDVRDIGSGNIGATNVLRTGNKFIAAATLLADVGKGFFAVWIAANWGPDQAIMAGLGAFLGHCFPIWLKFKGGKAVATFIGVLLALSFKTALIFGAVWLSVAAISRYSSLAGLLAVIATPLALFYFGEAQSGELFALLTVIVVLKHHANIRRLMSGNESKIGGG